MTKLTRGFSNYLDPVLSKCDSSFSFWITGTKGAKYFFNSQPILIWKPVKGS